MPAAATKVRARGSTAAPRRPAPGLAALLAGVERERLRIDWTSTPTAGRYPRVTGEFWSAAQRRGHSLHEVSYRACFKAELPRFFIERLTAPGEVVLDPFAGRGTTVLEANLLGRPGVANDVNPLARRLLAPRTRPPRLEEVCERLARIPLGARRAGADPRLLAFYHRDTLREIVSLRAYLARHRDPVDEFIEVVAATRLWGHSSGFFSVYSLPPNQAPSLHAQERINARLAQIPERRPVAPRILAKARSLLRDVTPEVRAMLARTAPLDRYCCDDSRALRGTADASVDLIVTSPPFLDQTDYLADNWLKMWFLRLSARDLAGPLVTTPDVRAWENFMEASLREFHRVLRPGRHAVVEVGEVARRGVRHDLDEHIAERAARTGFAVVAVLVNQQRFTKTAHIFRVTNNRRGTNTNRMVVLQRA
jgi:DNA modification methylase